MKSYAVFLVLLINGICSGQAAINEFEHILESGRKAQTAGKWKEAINAYEKAVQCTEIDSEMVQASLKSAIAVQSWMSLNPKITNELLDLAKRRYTVVIEKGNLKDRRVAANNLSVLLIEHSKYEEAKTLLENVDFSNDPNAFIFNYNYARALEGSGDPYEAFEYYLKTLNARPRFNFASDRALDLAVTSEAKDLDRCVALMIQTLYGGSLEALDKQLATALKTWGKKEPLIEMLVYYCARAKFTPSDFEEKNSMALQEAWRIDNLQPFMNDLLKVYQEGNIIDILPEVLDTFLENRYSFEQSVEKHERCIVAIVNRFESWSGISTDPLRPARLRKALSWLLQRIGNYYYYNYQRMMSEDSGDSQEESRESRTTDNEQLDPQLQLTEAAARYLAAWILDISNTEAALCYTSILREGPNLDPEGMHFQKFIDILFHIKAGIYTHIMRDGQINLREVQWKNLYFLHWTLGNIFEKEEKLHGMRYDDDDPRSSKFQFKRAVEVEKLILDEFDAQFAVSEKLRDKAKM